MPAWTGQTGTSSGRQWSSGGSLMSSGMGGVYHPTGGSGQGLDDTSRPGVVTVNPFDPNATAQSVDGLGDFFKGLKEGIFGSDERAPGSGDHGGLLGNIPGLGDAGRGLSNAIGWT